VRLELDPPPAVAKQKIRPPGISAAKGASLLMK
jgi:hypothetical protein